METVSQKMLLTMLEVGGRIKLVWLNIYLLKSEQFPHCYNAQNKNYFM